MTNYPSGYDTFRIVENIRGVNYYADDTQTLFAEDTNNHSDAITAIEHTLGENPQGDYPTVADRLAAGGGGGGAWELIFDEVVTGGQPSIICDTLDLQADQIYNVFFGSKCTSEITRFEFAGTSAISFGCNGWSSIGGMLTGINSIPYLSHQSIGPGAGNFLIQATENGSMAGKLAWSLGNQRSYEVIGSDINYYSGGQNLKKIVLRTNTDYNLSPGSYLRIFKAVL